MSKTATATPNPAKAHETVEKTLKANQAAAEKVAKVGKETAEKALKAGSEVVTKAYEQAMFAAKETVQKTFPQAAARFEELAGLQRANLEALFAAGSTAMKGVETLSDEMLAFNKKAIEEVMANARKMLECKTVQELVEFQTGCACSQLEQIVAHGSKVTDLTLKMAGEIAAPIQDRLGKTVEKLSKPPAA
jgi:phasin family protein